MTPAERESVRLVLVGGHESAGTADLESLADALPGAILTRPGRPLHNRVSTLLADHADHDTTVAVLPVTWGRDPVLVADTAKTLSWLRAGSGPGRLVLCDALGAIDHLVALVRRAATETVKRRPGAALVLAAPSAGPFDDAELHRVAHLVRAHGTGTEVEVACGSDEAALRRAVRRARLLGAEEVVVVPAGFARTCPALDAAADPMLADPVLAGTVFYGPLLSEQATLRIVGQRLADARHRLGHGDDGIDAGLLADHGHGYAHSHAVEGHPHSHAHPHSHPPVARQPDPVR
ncbi:cobalamin biosynthesis protein CbiX [Nocardioides pantholopis]|uniref:cobalamin biosynthesis protein CbiX n=1 Tax=Nocardioides pantholopis TaxID=2483798 RepID=UPI000F074A86|nr:cobalamin biosynthesis protein CbiX [Nocardioides pantholopis]